MGKLIDLAGQRFGFWMVKSQVDNNAHGQTEWLCVCECGAEKCITSNSLRSYDSTSCGCNKAPSLINGTFGKLKVITQDITKNNGRRYWNCLCECGEMISVSTYGLRKGSVISCGCGEDNKLAHLLTYTYSTNNDACKCILNNGSIVPCESVLINGRKLFDSILK